MQVVNVQSVMICLAVSIQYVCVTDGQTDTLCDSIVRTMHTRRAVKTAQKLSVGISRSNRFSSDKTATLTHKLMYHGSSVVSRKPLCHSFTL